MKSRWIALVALLVAVVFVTAALAELSAFDIAKKSLELDRTKTKTSTYQLTVINKRGKKKEYKFKVWEKQYADGAKKLIRFVEPADASGTGLLNHEKKGADDLQWLFLPSLNKARRLAGGDRDGEFMGSDLFYEDMSTQSAEDFNHTLISQVMYNNKQCYLIESVPKPDVNSAYSKMRSWVDIETFVGYKIELYDKKNKLLKTVTSKKIEQIDGIWTTREAVVVTVKKGKAKTILKLLEREYNVDIPDNTFTKQFLERY